MTISEIEVIDCPVNYRPNSREVSNFRYNGDKFKADVNMNTTNVLCVAGGAILGAALMYYFLKKNS